MVSLSCSLVPAQTHVRQHHNAKPTQQPRATVVPNRGAGAVKRRAVPLATPKRRRAMEPK